MDNKVTVIIPTKNEAQTIEKAIKTIKKYADELLIVDGHSTDKTREIAIKNKARVILDPGKGKGSGIRTGIKNAKHDILVFIDADLSHEPKDIPKLVKPIKEGKAHLVIASRRMGGSEDLDMNKFFGGFIRQMGNDFITVLINKHWKVNLTEIENGFRAIRKDVALKLNLNANDFDIEQEMVQKCLKKGFIIKEVPSHEYARAGGKSKLSTWKAARQLAWRLLKDW